MNKGSKRNTFLYLLVTALIIAVVYLVVQRQIPEEAASIGDLDDDATDIVDVEQLPPESNTISIPGYPSEIQLAEFKKQYACLL